MKELNKEIERVKIVLENYLTQYDNTKEMIVKEILSDSITKVQERLYGLCKAKEIIDEHYIVVEREIK